MAAANQTMLLGTNVNAVLKGEVLVITIDLSERAGLSTSGKNTMVASTHGNKVLPGGVTLGINAYVPVGA